MFDKEKYKKAVDRLGLKGTFIAKEIGMNYAIYTQKCCGNKYWKVDEALRVSKLLKLRNSERDAIFFAPEVSKSPTSDEVKTNE